MADLKQFPYLRLSSAGNMAFDAVMLEHGFQTRTAYWRLYGWNEPALTFGYSQKWEEVRLLSSAAQAVLVRRITGGGMVDHRQDLTYALSLPAGHPLHRSPAPGFYQGLHQCLAQVLRSLGFEADLFPCGGPCRTRSSSGSGICFLAPEPYDVVDPRTGRKLAGAALKRNRHGLLAQGSLEAGGLPGLDRGALAHQLAMTFSAWLGLSSCQPAESLPRELLEREEARFASVAWNRLR